jgi:hypothetical protein
VLSFAISLVTFGLLVTCVAGFQVLLYGVDLLRGVRARPATRPADLVLYGLSVLGVLSLVAGLLLLHSAAGTL